MTTSSTKDEPLTVTDLDQFEAIAWESKGGFVAVEYGAMMQFIEFARQALSQTHSGVEGKTAARGLEERNKVIEECAAIAEMACLVPPDGGCPHPMEVQVADVAAERIRALLQSSKTGQTP